jgi:D-arginine dehydrogenase
MSYDIAIIGAGIAGASVAWSLAQRAPGLKVVLVEGESQPGYHTTGRSAAFWVESYGGPGIVPLTRAGRGFFDAPPEGFNTPLLTPRPGLFIAPPDDAEFADANGRGALATMAAEFDEGGVPYTVMDAEMLAGTPAAVMLKPEWRQRGLWQDGGSDIDVAALHQGYLRGREIVRDARVTGIARDSAGWRLDTTGGLIVAKTIVNAAGAWGDEIAALAGVKPLGLRPLRRSMAVLVTDPPPPADLPVVLDAAGRFYFKPDGGRLWLSPHDETPDVPHDVRPDEMDLAVVIDRFEQASPVTVKRLDSSWAGLRTFAPDRLPVFGFDAAVPDFFWCVGQGGVGIQTAPAAGELCAALLLGEAPAVDARPYAPARFEM